MTEILNNHMVMASNQVPANKQEPESTRFETYLVDMQRLSTAKKEAPAINADTHVSELTNYMQQLQDISHNQQF